MVEETHYEIDNYSYESQSSKEKATNSDITILTIKNRKTDLQNFGVDDKIFDNVTKNIISNEIKNPKNIKTLKTEDLASFFKNADSFLNSQNNDYDSILLKQKISEELNNLINKQQTNFPIKNEKEKEKTNKYAYQTIELKMKELGLKGDRGSYSDKWYKKLEESPIEDKFKNFMKIQKKEENKLKNAGKPYTNYARNVIVTYAIRDGVLNEIYNRETISNQISQSKLENLGNKIGLEKIENTRKYINPKFIEKVPEEDLIGFIEEANDYIESQKNKIEFGEEILLLVGVNEKFEEFLNSKPNLRKIYEKVSSENKVDSSEIKFLKEDPKTQVFFQKHNIDSESQKLIYKSPPESRKKLAEAIIKQKNIQKTIEIVNNPEKLTEYGYSPKQIVDIQNERKELQEDSEFNAFLFTASEIYKRVNVNFNLSLDFFKIGNFLNKVIPEENNLESFGIEDLEKVGDEEYFEYIESPNNDVDIAFDPKNLEKFGENTLDFSKFNIKDEEVVNLKTLCQKPDYEKIKMQDETYKKLPKQQQILLDNYVLSLENNFSDIKETTSKLCKKSALSYCLNFLKTQMNVSFVEDGEIKDYLKNLELDKKDLTSENGDLVFNFEGKINTNDGENQDVKISYNVSDGTVYTYQEMAQDQNGNISVKNNELHPVPFKFPSLGEFERKIENINFGQIIKTSENKGNYIKKLQNEVDNIELGYNGLNREIFSKQLMKNRISATFMEVIGINKGFETKNMNSEMKNMYEIFYNTINLSNTEDLPKFEQNLKNWKQIPYKYVHTKKQVDYKTERGEEELTNGEIFSINKKLFKSENSFNSKFTNNNPSNSQNNSFNGLFQLLSYTINKQNKSSVSNKIINIDAFSNFTEISNSVLENKIGLGETSNFLSKLGKGNNEIKSNFLKYITTFSTEKQLSELDEQISSRPPTLPKERSGII